MEVLKARFGWSSEQPDLVKGCPCMAGVLELGGFYGPLPTQAILGFYDYSKVDHVLYLQLFNWFF